MVLSERPPPGLRQAPPGAAGTPGDPALSCERLVLVDCTAADLAELQILSDAAGWNQTADDWRVFVAHGKTMAYRSDRGELVASAAALPYRGATGWISMVLVAEPWRHQGLATRLLDMGIAHLQCSGATPYLDATPAGMPTYRKRGFLDGFGLARWEGRGAPADDAPGDLLRSADSDDLSWLLPLDAAANGVPRGFLLQNMLARAGTRAWAMRDGSGFVIRRQGRRASQIGPLVAANETSAQLLLQAALAGPAEPVFLDLPDHWQALARMLTLRGFVIQRPFVRMALDAMPAQEPGEQLFVLAGPEFG